MIRRMMNQNKELYLITILKTELMLVLTSQSPNKTFSLKGIQYVDEGFGDFVGFYDWLRNSDKQIIGVRHCPFEEFDIQYNAFNRFSYVAFDPDKYCLEIYFSSMTNFQESLSDDQSFLENKVFKSESGEYAFLYKADQITSFLAPNVYEKCFWLA